MLQLIYRRKGETELNRVIGTDADITRMIRESSTAIVSPGKPASIVFVSRDWDYHQVSGLFLPLDQIEKRLRHLVLT